MQSPFRSPRIRPPRRRFRLKLARPYSNRHAVWSDWSGRPDRQKKEAASVGGLFHSWSGLKAASGGVGLFRPPVASFDFGCGSICAGINLAGRPQRVCFKNSPLGESIMKWIVSAFAAAVLAVLSLSIPAPIFTNEAWATRMDGKAHCGQMNCAQEKYLAAKRREGKAKKPKTQ